MEKKSDKTVDMMDMMARWLDMFVMRMVDMVARLLDVVVSEEVDHGVEEVDHGVEQVDHGVEDQPEPWRLAPQVVAAAAHCPGNTGEGMVISGISRNF